VEVRAVDVNRSGWDCRLEPRPDGVPALRLGMRLVRGLGKDDADAVAGAVARAGSFASVEALHRAGGVRAHALRCLASADAFASMGLDRAAALWHVRALRDERLPLFDPLEAEPCERPAGLPRASDSEEVLRDYRSASLSLRAHPVSFLRDRLAERGAVPAAALADETRYPNGREAAVAGIVLVRQRPATASGIVFLTLEDESGTANLIARPAVFDRHRGALARSLLLVARGRIERQGAVVHLLVGEAEGLDPWMSSLAARSRDFH
jgi:error-prone DNA polymerase